MPFNPESGLYEIYEPPIDEAMSRSLLEHLEVNDMPTDRYSRPLQEIWHLDDVAERDGIAPACHMRFGITVSYILDVVSAPEVAPVVPLPGPPKRRPRHRSRRPVATGPKTEQLDFHIPSRPISSDDVDLYQNIVAKFEEAVNPESYFMYRYCKYLVWKYSRETNFRDLAERPKFNVSS